MSNKKRIAPKISGTDREQVRLAIEARNIESRPLWKPMHLQPVFSGALSYISGISENLFLKGPCLPSGSEMGDNEFNSVSEILRQVFHLKN